MVGRRCLTIRQAILTKYTGFLKKTVNNVFFSHHGNTDQMLPCTSHEKHECTWTSVFRITRKTDNTSNDENYYTGRESQNVNALNSYCQPEI